MQNEIPRSGRIASYLGHRANRARLRGVRIEVCAFLVARRPNPALLIVKSQWGPWMPCQEGVRFGETFEGALRRGLREELGIDLAARRGAPFVDDRGTSYLGTLKLSSARSDRGVRPVAPGLPDAHLLSHVKLRKKAYWALFRQIADREQLDPMPNGTEVVDYTWASLSEARRRFELTMAPEKAALIGRGLDACERIMAGTNLHHPPVA